MTWAFLFQMIVPESYLGDMVLTVAYLINRLPLWVIDGLSPIEPISSFILFVPFLASLHSRVFGYVVFVHVHS